MTPAVVPLEVCADVEGPFGFGGVEASAADRGRLDEKTGAALVVAPVVQKASRTYPPDSYGASWWVQSRGALPRDRCPLLKRQKREWRDSGLMLCRFVGWAVGSTITHVAVEPEKGLEPLACSLRVSCSAV